MQTPPEAQAADETLTREAISSGTISKSSPIPSTGPSSTHIPSLLALKIPNKFTPPKRQYAAHLDDNWGWASWRAHSNIREMLFLLGEARATGEDVGILEHPNASAEQLVDFIIKCRNRRIDDGIVKGEKQGKPGPRKKKMYPVGVGLAGNAPRIKRAYRKRQVPKSELRMQGSKETRPVEDIATAVSPTVRDRGAFLTEPEEISSVKSAPTMEAPTIALETVRRYIQAIQDEVIHESRRSEDELQTIAILHDAYEQPFISHEAQMLVREICHYRAILLSRNMHRDFYGLEDGHMVGRIEYDDDEDAFYSACEVLTSEIMDSMGIELEGAELVFCIENIMHEVLDLKIQW